jgi:aspartyl-tRNA(Asn)/glutamyl-tRNA(Gln) amidotransferase subunit A
MTKDIYHDIQASHQPFTAIADEQNEANGVLDNYDISIKDNIVYEELPTTAGSSILNEYQSSYTADVVRFLKEEGATIIGKTKMDAFGFGTYGQNMENPPKHPERQDLVPGGSSAGSAVLTKLAPDTHVSIAVSTGGSISCPAALCGVIGYTPTKGHVSRHGLIPYADSFDSIGCMATTITSIQDIEPVITQHTSKDMTHDLERSSHDVSVIGIPEELNDLPISEPVREHFEEYIQRLKEEHAVKHVPLPKTYEHSVATYYTIATSEASTNLARYDGMRYGEQPEPRGDYDDFVADHRGKQFGLEEKRRVILGTYIRTKGYDDKLYERAQTARQHIKQEFDDTFDDVDAIMTPAMPFKMKTIQEAEQENPAETYAADLLTTPPMLGNLPHVTLPHIPGGLQFITPQHTDRDLLKAAKSLP